MNTKDEIVKVFDDGVSDSAPPALFVQTGTAGQMEACGASWPDANYDAEKMARLALQPHEMFGFANARVPFCITIDADSFGCTVDPGTPTSQPMVASSPFRDDMGFMDVPDSLISPEEFIQRPRIQTLLKACDILGKREDLFLVGALNGTISCANNLLGMENILMALLMEPDKVTKWMDALVPHVTAYAHAISERTDDVFVIEDASSDIIPPDYFDVMVTPYLPKVISGIDCFSTVHTCGGTQEVAHRLASQGEDSISLEASWDPEGYMSLVDGAALMLGCVNPVGTLLGKGPADVVAEAKRSADAGFAIVMPECGVPPMTPNDNLLALSQ
ncbi:MAG: hypothetical protein IJ856_04575 [Candidatus Methanomethylophilaceae archaeon]|nr:hypothetical protein [Candidatus Methanomethylophilaceae archaeon]